MPQIFRKQDILIKHGAGYRPYAFSLFELVETKNGVNQVIGSGMAPDYDSVYNYLPMGDAIGDQPQMVGDNVVDPSWLWDNTCATGLRTDRVF
jgi:hypothetical protein